MLGAADFVVPPELRHAAVEYKRVIASGPSDERSALLERVRLLEEALMPFAEAARRYEDVTGHHTYLDLDELGSGRLTVGDLRRARAALKGEQPK